MSTLHSFAGSAFSLASALLLAAVMPLHAQLVADGATRTINGTSTNVAGSLTIGTNGSFTTLIITNAGAVTNSGFSAAIGLNPSAMTNRVIVTGTNSVWNSLSDLVIGSSGSFNALTVTNGGQMLAQNANLGLLSAGANNSATVTGHGSLWSLSELTVGNSGPSNRLVIANGGHVECEVADVGLNASVISNSPTYANSVVVTDPGSTWDIVPNWLSLGSDSPRNQMTITNGGTVYSYGFYIGGKIGQSGSGSSNSVIITGAGSTLTNGTTSSGSIGDFGAFNQLTITNGGVMNNSGHGSLVLGRQVSGTNNVILVTDTNSQFLIAGLNQPSSLADLIIGQNGSFNQLIVRNGGLAQADTGELAQNSGSSSNLAVIANAGSRWVCVFNLYVGNAGSGNQLTVQNGGTVSAGNCYLGFANTSSNNTVNVSDGNILATNVFGTGLVNVVRGSVTLNPGLLRTDLLLLTNGAQSQFSFNGGTLQLGSTTNTKSSPFIIGDGTSSATLELLGNGTHVFAAGLLLTNNALLKGNGSIIANVTNASGGTLSPGASIGKLVINGNLLLAAGSTNVFELNKTSGTNDNIIGLISVTYGGTLQLTNLSGTLAGSDAFKLFTGASYNGAFSALSPSAPGANTEWDTNDLAISGTLRVASAPYITSQPADKTISVGQSATFSVTALGSVSLSYQWRFSGTNIGGANSNSYTRVNAQFADVGGYEVVITNILGSVTSRLASLTVIPVQTTGTNVVISQIYGGGGNSSASFKNDFVELFNPTTNTIDVSTWSIQYATSAGTSWSVANLRSTIAPYHYYLMQLFSNGAIGATLPTADATNTINLNAQTAKIALVNNQAPLSGSNPSGAPGVFDFVGYGSSANGFEGSGPAAGPPAANNITSVLRKNGGYTDANDNTNDFITISPPTPRNTASPANPPSVPAIPATLSAPGYDANNQFQFTVTGTAGTNYIVQVSTNLATTNWLARLTNASPFSFTQFNANTFTQQFYRAVSP